MLARKAILPENYTKKQFFLEKIKVQIGKKTLFLNAQAMS